MLADKHPSIHQLLLIAVKRFARKSGRGAALDVDEQIATIMPMVPSTLPISRQELRAELARIAVEHGVPIRMGGSGPAKT